MKGSFKTAGEMASKTASQITRFTQGCASLALIACCLFMSGPARANPRALPFTYPHQTLPKGAFEVEQYVDMIPVRVERVEDNATKAVTSVRSQLQTEFEVGLADWLELGGYIVFWQSASGSTPALRFQGVKERLRFRLAPEGAWPINVGLYIEAAQYHDELEFEQKLILSRRFGALNIATNLWVEQEWYFQTRTWKFIYNPTLGVSYDLSPKFSLGLEYWARGRFNWGKSADGQTEQEVGTRHYVGPTMMAQRGELFVSLGAYLRADHLAEKLAVGDPWGRVYLRLLLGIGL